MYVIDNLVYYMGIYVYMYIYVWIIMVKNKNKMIIYVIVYFKRYININV